MVREEAGGGGGGDAVVWCAIERSDWVVELWERRMILRVRVRVGEGGKFKTIK